MEQCGYCKEKEERVIKYLEGLEEEKIRECRNGLEREKIAKGMTRTKEDEKRLKEVQKMQIEEKRRMEHQQSEIDMMWHQVLLDGCNKQEHQEQIDARRRQQEMIERRKSYDEQIASSNRQRQEAMKQERERENKKLERMKKKMEQDHYEAIKKKKDQQLSNRKNYIEGHEDKVSRIRNEKARARQLDDNAIRVALEELKLERERNRLQMKNLQLEKKFCLENYNRERKIAAALDEECEKLTNELRDREQGKADEHIMQIERDKRTDKEKAKEEYKTHLQKLNLEEERAKEYRRIQMEKVRGAAYVELHRKLDDADQAIRRQIEYRNSLSRQIIQNDKHLEHELSSIENKDRAFTKKAMMFKDVMASKYSSSTGRESTNPVHPFRRIIESKDKNTTLHLPSIN